MKLLCFALFSGLLLVAPAVRSAEPVITEFMSASNGPLLDEDGDASDWIEIFNPGPDGVNLAGWSLTDDPENLARWQFPATNLNSGAYIVVFASGKNRVVTGARLHTSFQLDADGEYLALVAPDGITVASEYGPKFPEQYLNVSYGLDATNSELQHRFAIPTPGAPNGTNYFVQVADTKFEPDRGFYETNFAVTITCATTNAVIRYTLNGTAPNRTNGFIYAGPISVTNTTTLRAAAFKDGFASSDVDTHTYIFVRDVVKQSANGAPPPGWPATWGANRVDYGMDTNIVNNSPWRETLTNDLKSIPTLSVVVNLPDLFSAATGIYANPGQDGIAWERPMSMELLQPDGDTSRQMHINGGIRLRGGFSRNTTDPKHSFRFFFRSEYGPARLNFPFFGPDAPRRFKKFDLRTNQDDSWHFTNASGEFMRDAFSRDCLLACGQVQTHGDYYHLYINGQYWGLYTSEERPEANFMEDYFGGDAANYDVMKVEAGPYNTVATDGNTNAFLRLWQAATNGFATDAAYQKVQGNLPDGTPNPSYENLLEVPNLIDYMLCIFYAGNLDAPASTYTQNNNWYGARNRDNLHGGFRFFLHDSENSLYGINDNRTGPGSSAGDPTRGSGFSRANPEYIFHRLATNAEFRVLLGDHIQQHFFNGGAFTVEAVTNRYFKRRNEISRAVVVESARWGDAQREPPYNWNDFRAASDALVANYFPVRTDIVLNQLRARGFFPAVPAPVFNRHGGSVPAGFELIMTNPSASGGTIFFTLDGDDPRVRGGGVSPAAQAYATPVVLNTSTEVKARIRNGTNWSALTRAVFYVPQDFSQLAITEIMYNPPRFGTVDGTEVEFVELQNTGTNSLNLSGLSFTSGISFAFTNGTQLEPGAFFVLARNTDMFAAKYPGAPVNGVFSGRLDNAGETLRISYALGGAILSVAYADSAPWPVTPDALGFSLVPAGAGTNPNPDRASGWRASTRPGGSPGEEDPALAIPPILINEALTSSVLPDLDQIELFNPSAGAVDLSGWYLTDERDTPRKFRIPGGTSIGAGGYVVFDEAQFNPTPGATNNFSLRAEGDDLYLFSADLAGNLTGYSHGFAFGAAERGVSFGRYRLSTGEDDFTAQVATSWGAANAGPKIGPIVISEIHYHPDLGDDEFIELRNLTDAPVRLFDSAAPTNTWRLNGLGFQFPPDVALPADGSLLIVPTEPAAFRSKYGVPLEVAILGPYAGQLQDSGELLELQKPGPPDTNGAIAYINVDAVRFNDRAPWPPAADGSGPSLQRRELRAYGNDEVNWESALATPGRAFTGGPSPVIVTLPANLTVVATREATFSVTAAGPPPLYYQWRHNGALIPNATNATLLLTNLHLSDAGAYSVLVFNENGSVESAAGILTILLPADIRVQPTNRLVRIRPDPAAAPQSNATFFVLASSTTPLHYQWLFNGTNISGATSTSYTVTNVQLRHEGYYAAAITDAAGTIFSTGAYLQPLISPVAVQQPVSQAIVAGGTVTLSMAVSGHPRPFSYEWRRASLPLLTNVSLATNDFFTFTAPNVATSQTYRVVVRNLANPTPGLASAPATISVRADSDGDGLPDDWEEAHGLATNDPADAALDSDGDGMTNSQEYLAGTDPTDPLSRLKIDSLAAAGGARITFGTVSNRTYTVEYIDKLGAERWSTLVYLAARATNFVETVFDPGFTNSRTYRLVTPRQP